MSRSVAGALIPASFRINTRQADTSGATIPLNMGYNQEMNFSSSDPITAPATVQLVADSQGRIINWSFTIDAVVDLTFPANFKMSDANYDDATHTWTPTDTGTYYMTAWFDGTNWNVTDMTGPENT